VEFFRGDIRDSAAIRAACESVDVVYHNVAQVPLAKNRRLFQSVNCHGTQNLIAAIRETGVDKLVHTSSSAVFGAPRRNPVDETTECRPGEAYGKAKLEAELLVARACEASALDATIIRPRTILGHGRLGIFQILFEWVAEGRKIPVLGRGDNLYQFVHAEDLADACIRAAGRPGLAIYNVGAARFGTMRETLEALCEHAGTGSRVISVPMELAIRLMEVTSRTGLSPLGPYHSLMYGRSLYFDISRAEEQLDWHPRWSNAEMICESYDWYLANQDSIRRAGDRSPHRSAVKQGILGILKRCL
jgi:nucleoside-diphosphate-sugar epimerase